MPPVIFPIALAEWFRSRLNERTAACRPLHRHQNDARPKNAAVAASVSADGSGITAATTLIEPFEIVNGMALPASSDSEVARLPNAIVSVPNGLVGLTA